MDFGSIIAPGMSGIGEDIFGRKPTGAELKRLKPIAVEPGEAAARATESNIANFPEISKLGDLYSSEQLRQLEKILPGYGDSLTAGKATTDQLFGQASQLLAGEIPQDVQDQVYRSSAYGALRGGFQGSPMANALTARDLGLTSLNLLNQGASLAGQGVNSMQAWDALARRDMFEPSSMFVSPTQQIDVEQANNAALQAFRAMKLQSAIAPDPVAKGAFDSFMQVLGEVLSIYGGGSGYKPTASTPVNYNVGYNQGAAYGQAVPQSSFNQGTDALYGGGGGGGGLGGIFGFGG